MVVLPPHTEVFSRDRAFSWDLVYEEHLQADALIEHLNQYRKRSNSKVDFEFFDMKFPDNGLQKKRKIDIRDNVATVQLESGSGATTVIPTIPECDGYVHGSTMIGAYTKEQRQLLIEKFRAKKKRRVWRKQIKYDCRKTLADNRPRVKGRFVSRKERGEDDRNDASSSPEMVGIDTDSPSRESPRSTDSSLLVVT